MRANLSRHMICLRKLRSVPFTVNTLSQFTATPFCCHRLVAQLCLGFPVLHCLLEFPQTHVHGVGDAIQPSHALPPLLFLPSISTSIRVFSIESTLSIRWQKNCDFGFNNFVSRQIEGKGGSSERFYFLGLQKSLLMVTSAMK